MSEGAEAVGSSGGGVSDGQPRPFGATKETRKSRKQSGRSGKREERRPDSAGL